MHAAYTAHMHSRMTKGLVVLQASVLPARHWMYEQQELHDI
jgi:hypothetical protein